VSTALVFAKKRGLRIAIKNWHRFVLANPDQTDLIGEFRQLGADALSMAPVLEGECTDKVTDGYLATDLLIAADQLEGPKHLGLKLDRGHPIIALVHSTTGASRRALELENFLGLYPEITRAQVLEGVDFLNRLGRQESELFKVLQAWLEKHP
jgi:hypothetical protein